MLTHSRICLTLPYLFASLLSSASHTATISMARGRSNLWLESKIGLISTRGISSKALLSLKSFYFSAALVYSSSVSSISSSTTPCLARFGESSIVSCLFWWVTSSFTLSKPFSSVWSLNWLSDSYLFTILLRMRFTHCFTRDSASSTTTNSRKRLSLVTCSECFSYLHSLFPIWDSSLRSSLPSLWCSMMSISSTRVFSPCWRHYESDLSCKLIKSTAL